MFDGWGKMVRLRSFLFGPSFGVILESPQFEEKIGGLM